MTVDRLSCLSPVFHHDTEVFSGVSVQVQGSLSNHIHNTSDHETQRMKFPRQCLQVIKKVTHTAYVARLQVLTGSRSEDFIWELVGKIPVETRAWLRDAFSLQQEVLQSALTFSTIFPEPIAWGGW